MRIQILVLGYKGLNFKSKTSSDLGDDCLTRITYDTKDVVGFLKKALENLTTYCNHEQNYTSKSVCNFGTERAA